MPTDHDQRVDLVSNNGICEAVRCFEKATSQKVVKAGDHREITLNLCKNCIDKFEDR